MNKTAGQKAAGGDGKRGGGRTEMSKGEAAGMKKKIVVLVREDRNADEYLKRQTKGNDTL